MKSFQKLMGRLNDISIMCPFLKGFKMPLNMCLSAAIAKEVPFVELSASARGDLEVWARFLMDKEKWIPICHRYSSPPIFHSYFTSDAAGSSVDSSDNYRLGCGNVGFSGDGVIIFAYQLFWPKGVLQAARDNKNCSLGSKTTTLEFLGILVPFLVAPELMLNQNSILHWGLNPNLQVVVQHCIFHRREEIFCSHMVLVNLSLKINYAYPLRVGLPERVSALAGRRRRGRESSPITTAHLMAASTLFL